MKRTKLVAIVMAIVMIVGTTSVAFASNGCGYHGTAYDYECKECRNELCEEGIHFYLKRVHYYNHFSGYGECYCGKRKEFTSYMNGKNWYEPYPGMISIPYRGNWEIFVEANHPHREFDPYTGSLYYKEELDGRIGNCGVCDMLNAYKEEVEAYNEYIAERQHYYDDDSDYWDEYDEDYYEYDSDYWNEYADDYYEDDTDYDDEYDDNLYEWLEMVKDILD